MFNKSLRAKSCAAVFAGLICLCQVNVASVVFGVSVANSMIADNNNLGAANKKETQKTKIKVEDNPYEKALTYLLHGEFSLFYSHVSEKFPHTTAVTIRIVIFLSLVFVAGAINGIKYAFRNEYGWKLHAFKNAFREVVKNPFVYIPAVACLV